MGTFNKGFKEVPGSEAMGAGSHDKILSIYEHQGGNLPYENQNRAKVLFKNSLSFEKSVADLSASGTFEKLAGTSLNNVFYPFETRYGSGYMPCFHIGMSGLITTPSGNFVDAKDLLPFKFDSAESGYIYYRPTVGTDHDGLSNLISSERYYGDTDTFRDISHIKGIGFRLPSMGIGWRIHHRWHSCS